MQSVVATAERMEWGLVGSGRFWGCITGGSRAAAIDASTGSGADQRDMVKTAPANPFDISRPADW